MSRINGRIGFVRVGVIWIFLVIVGQLGAVSSPVQAVTGPPLEQMELGGLLTQYSPQLQDDALIEPESHSTITAELTLSQPVVAPGQTVTLTVNLRNEGTAVSAAYDLHLWLDDSLTITSTQAFQTSNIGQMAFTSQPLAPGESHQQVLILQVSQTADQD